MLLWLGTWLFGGCGAKRIMPTTPNEPMMFDLDFSYTLDFERPDIPDDATFWALDLRLTVVETHRDDSLSLQLDFVDVQFRESQTDSWSNHPLESQQLVVRCFPWGELLLVEGWDTISVLEDVQWLDFMFGTLFPNPPVRSGQQWNSRLLPWPYYLNPEPHSKQIVSATWSQPSDGAWTYEGSWYGKRGVTPLFDGRATGSITASTPWIATHTFDWTRTLSKPIVAEQHIMGSLEQR